MSTVSLTQADRWRCHWLMTAGPAFSIRLTISVSVLQDVIFMSQVRVWHRLNATKPGSVWLTRLVIYNVVGELGYRTTNYRHSRDYRLSDDNWRLICSATAVHRDSYCRTICATLYVRIAAHIGVGWSSMPHVKQYWVCGLLTEWHVPHTTPELLISINDYNVISRYQSPPSALPHFLLALYGDNKTTEQRTIHQYGDWYTGRWCVGCYIWYSEEGPGRGRSRPPRPLLAVPNITAHPSTASVPSSYHQCDNIHCGSKKNVPTLADYNYDPV